MIELNLANGPGLVECCKAGISPSEVPSAAIRKAKLFKLAAFGSGIFKGDDRQRSGAAFGDMTGQDFIAQSAEGQYVAPVLSADPPYISRRLSALLL